MSVLNSDLANIASQLSPDLTAYDRFTTRIAFVKIDERSKCDLFGNKV